MRAERVEVRPSTGSGRIEAGLRAHEGPGSGRSEAGSGRIELMGRHAVGGKPRLRIDRLVDIAVLHTGGIELEVQVSTECAAGLANAADDLPGLHWLAGAYGHG